MKKGNFTCMKMLKLLAVSLIILVPNFLHAQGGWTRPNVSYGNIQYRISLDSALLFPTGNGAPTSLHAYDLHKAAFYFDSTNDNLYVYNPKPQTWTLISGGGGGGSTNTNIGSGYTLAVEGTNDIKTLFGANGILIDSTSNADGITFSIDTNNISFSGDTTIVNNFVTHKSLLIPRTDTVNARQRNGSIIYDTIANHYYGYVNGDWFCLECEGLSSVAWGDITGTLSDQTDLQSALNAKLNISDTASMLSPYLRTAGDLNPLFTTTESSQNISFAQQNTTQYNVLGRIASGSGPYSFVTADSTLVQGLHSENYYNTKYVVGRHDSDAYHTMTSLSDSTVRFNRPNGTGDTLLLAIGVSVDSLWRTPGVDSIKFYIDGRYHAIKDSTSSGATLTTNAIGYGIGNVLGGTVDSLSYVPANRVVTVTNSQAGATFAVTSTSTVPNSVGLILQNTSPATASITGLSSPILAFGSQAWKSNATAGSWTNWYGIGSVGTTGATSTGGALQFYSLGGVLNGTPTSMSWIASMNTTGAFTAASSIMAGGTGGAGTFFGSGITATTTSGTSISLIASNASNSFIKTAFSSQETMKIFQATGNVNFQNLGTIPADPADGGQFNIYQQSGMTGIGSITGTSGTATATNATGKFFAQVQPGDQIAIAGTGAETLTVLSITDDTHLVFTANMASNHTNAAYTIIPATARKFTVYNNGNTLQNGKPIYNSTITAAGTTGNQTINKPSGTVNIAASGTSVVVTNGMVTTSSIIHAIVRTNDANKTAVYAVVPAAGSFTIYVTPAPAAEISIGFIVNN